jgi:hypothetical protein
LPSAAGWIETDVPTRCCRLHLEARGEKRGRYYVATETLTRIRADVVADREPDMFGDPFAD